MEEQLPIKKRPMTEPSAMSLICSQLSQAHETYLECQQTIKDQQETIKKQQETIIDMTQSSQKDRNEISFLKSEIVRLRELRRKDDAIIQQLKVKVADRKRSPKRNYRDRERRRRYTSYNQEQPAYGYEEQQQYQQELQYQQSVGYGYPVSSTAPSPYHIAKPPDDSIYYV